MNLDEEHIDPELLSRHFSGETSSAEDQQIEAWKNSSSAAADLYFQSQVVFMDLGSLRIDTSQKEFDSHAAFENVKLKKNQLVQAGGKAFMSWQKVAAVVSFILMGLSWWLLKEEVPESTQVSNVNQQILEHSLPDSSIVTLNEASTIAFVEKGFNQSRSLELTGEAFFEVARDTKSPFEVEAQGILVTVLGTSFNIKANPESDSVSVFVESGLVRVSAPEDTVTLEKGMSVIFVKSLRQLLIQEATVSKDIHFWRTKTLDFDGIPLGEVVQILSRVFERDIALKDSGLSSCEITVVFRNESFSNILDIISTTLGLDVTEEGQKIWIEGEGC